MNESANIIAWVALIGWPIVTFRLLKKYELSQAVIYAIVVPYLFLPVKTELDLPLIPPIGKSLMASLGLLMALHSKKVSFLQPPQPVVPRVVLLLLFVTPFLTYYTNREPAVFTAVVMPGLTVIDIMGMMFESFLFVYVPFMIGYKLLSRPEDHETLVKILLFFALVYSVLILWEIRMSPQLHRTLYGFFPHDWRQQIRYGGFRPVVFLGHGLFVAIFVALSVLCAVTVWRNAEPKSRGRSFLVFVYLFAVLVLCKSVGSFVLAAIFGLSLWLFSPKLQLKLSYYLMIVVLVFPVFRSSEYFPDEGLINLFSRFDAERAGSLNFRFENENLLLDRAAEKSFTGWGGWGRNLLYSDRTGESIITVDGYWIIVYSKFGWIGYIAMFCVYALPVLAQARRSRKRDKDQISPFTACLCCLLTVNLLDSLVNASVTIVTGLIAGAVWANAYAPEEVRQVQSQQKGFKDASARAT